MSPVIDPITSKLDDYAAGKSTPMQIQNSYACHNYTKEVTIDKTCLTVLRGSDILPPDDLGCPFRVSLNKGEYGNENILEAFITRGTISDCLSLDNCNRRKCLGIMVGVTGNLYR